MKICRKCKTLKEWTEFHEGMGRNPSPLPTLQSNAMTARDFAIVMAYEAFRICLGIPTKTPPEKVISWMKTILKTP